ITAGSDLSGPGVTYDGDFTVPSQMGQPIFEISFEADPKPYSYKVQYSQLRASYSEPALNSAGPYGGFFVGPVKGSFSDLGGAVISFWWEYAVVPPSHNEYETFGYGYQIIGYTVAGTDSPDYGKTTTQLGEVTLTVN